MLIELKIAMLRQGRSQRDVSQDARIPETRLSAIVCGRSVATAEERLAICRLLNVSEDVFSARPVVHAVAPYAANVEVR